MKNLSGFRNPLAWIFSIAYVIYAVYNVINPSADGLIILATTPFVDLAGSCAKITRELEDIAKNNYGFHLGRKTGMLDALLEPSNGSIKLDLNNVQAGKKFVKTKLHYKVRTKPCEILQDSAVPSICTEGAEPVELSVDVTINKHMSTPVRSFTNSDMVNICQDTSSFIQEYMLSDMRALREKSDEFQLAQATNAIGRGRHQDGSTDTLPFGHKAKRLLGSSTDTGAVTPLYANFADVILDYQFNQLNGVPMLVGEGNLQKFFMLSNYSCCNAPGVAYESAVATAGAAFFLDQAGNSILGTNNFLSIAPNTLHVLWFNENTNVNIDSAIRKQIVVQDPVYPQLKWDMDWEYTCDKVWSYKLSAWMDQFQAIRSDAFGTDFSPQVSCEDELAGMTGVFGWTGTN